MKPNVELLKRVLAHIEAHPEQWDQSNWRRETGCGTAYCFAGWTAVLTGATFYRDPVLGGRVVDYLVVPPGGDAEEPIDEYAARVLGIERWETDEDADLHLFAEENTLDDLRRIVAEACEEAES